MATLSGVLIRFRAELGYVEGSGNRTKYGAWYGLDGQPWCAMFLSWVFWHAGMPIPASTSKGFAYTPSGAAYFKREGRWRDASARPEPGWIAFYDFPNDGVNRISHVGIVETVHGVRDITAIEGNTDERGGRTGGKVMRRRRTVGIVGYGLPEYEPESMEELMRVTNAVAGILGSEIGVPGAVVLLSKDGGVFIFGANTGWNPFSYTTLPPEARRGEREFVDIRPRTDGRPGYTLIADDGATYTFPTQ